MTTLTPKAEYMKNSLTKEEFLDWRIDLIGKFEKDRYNGLYLEEYQDIIEAKHEKILDTLEKTFDKNPQIKGLKIPFMNIISFFLDDALYHYGSEASMMLEDKILDFLFDRFIRKYPGPFHEKKLALSAIIFFYRVMLSWKMIPEELYLFVKDLKNEETFFIKHCKNYKGSGFFWDKDPQWNAAYGNWLERKGFVFPLYPIDITPIEFVGPLENDLVRMVQQLLFVRRRELIKKYHDDSTKVNDILVKDLDDWYNQPQKLLSGLTPRDVILLERYFMFELSDE